jgi:hypothetical protein
MKALRNAVLTDLETITSALPGGYINTTWQFQKGPQIGCCRVRSGASRVLVHNGSGQHGNPANRLWRKWRSGGAPRLRGD